jgi:hypothetical protein
LARKCLFCQSYPIPRADLENAVIEIVQRAVQGTPCLIVSRAKPNIGPGAFLADALLQVGATKPILVGHSIGGMIVQQLLPKSLMSSLRRSRIQIWAASSTGRSEATFARGSRRPHNRF